MMTMKTYMMTMKKMKLIFENWRGYLKEYKEKRFPRFGETSLKYILKKNPYINNGEPYYEMHIGVDPEFQGQGVAGKIIMEFADKARFPLFFAKARIINPNLVKVLERLEDNPRVERVDLGWLII